MPWYDDYFSAKWQKRFRFQAKQIFSKHPDLIDDAMQSANAKMLQELQGPKMRAQISDAYVLTCFINGLKDEHRAHFGRCRPYEWVERLGDFWKRIAEMLCYEQLPTDVIAERMCNREQTAMEKNLCIERVETVVAALKQRPFCSIIGAREIQPPEDVEYGDSGINRPEDDIAGSELKLLMAIILEIQESEFETLDVSRRLLERWQALSDELSEALQDDDRLLLKLIHVEGYNVTTAAAMLGKPRHTCDNNLKKVYRTLQKIMLAHGVSLDMLDTGVPRDDEGGFDE